MNVSFRCAAVLIFSSLCMKAQAPVPVPPSPQELQAIADRGRALAEYDQAAWHGSDAAMALQPSAELAPAYVARKVDEHWVVAFGRLDGTKTSFAIAYEAVQQGDSPTEYKARKVEPPREDTGDWLHEVKAWELGKAEFMRSTQPQRPYNFSALPGPSGNWFVYAIPAQTRLEILPWGGDVRYTISADGTEILEKRQMHKSVVEEAASRERVFGVHSHVLSDVPEDSDVFYANTRKAAKGELIISKTHCYAINPSGVFRYEGATSDVSKKIQRGEYEALEGPLRAMALRIIESLVRGTTPGTRVEGFAAHTGSRCQDGVLWLKVEIALHNSSEDRLILSKNALLNLQARFATNEADLLADKYEKLVFFTPNQDKLEDENSYLMLGPGMTYDAEREFPIMGLDLEGKKAVQFLFFTWPLGAKDQIEVQRKRWVDAGILFADDVFTLPFAISVDPALLENCGKKK